jgi:hypothetical protein
MALRLRLALGQHADNFAMGVLTDLPYQGFAVGLGHPVLRFDLAVGIDLLVKTGLKLRVFQRGHGCDLLLTGGLLHIERLCVHKV